VAVEEFPALRQRPGPAASDPLPASFLKHCDEQTLAGLAAVYRAIGQHGLTATAFTAWGVVAAPRYFGRTAMAQALHRFALEGAWGISPHLVPHRSLHSLSGTLSQALTIHGPNFGVGGGPGGAAEALAMTAAYLAGGDVPGVWLVLTGYEPELIPREPGSPAAPEGVSPPPLCGALALALTVSPPDYHGLQLRICPRAGGLPGNADAAATRPLRREALLAAFLETAPPAGLWKIGTEGWVELRAGRGPLSGTEKRL
jgi:hypothetical protein